MNGSKSVFSQLTDYLSWFQFQECVERYRGDYKLKSFSCWDQFLCMAFAQLTYRESLRDIEACLRANQTKLYHMGIRGRISRNTLAHANSVRDWRIYADFAHLLIQQARALYRDEEFGLALQQTVYALDATTIDLCLSLFPWAYFRKRKGAVKLHTLLDLRGNIPTVIIITHGLIHEVNILDQLTFEPGAFYVMDRAYLDFPPASIAFVVRFLCHPRPQTLRLPAALFAASRSHHRGHLRSDCRARQSSAAPGLSRQVTPHSLLRQHHEQASGLSYQQPHAATTDHRATLSQSLAGRVVLQMDQTTSAHQEVLRHFRECAQDSNLDRHLCLRAGRNYQKATESESQPLQNSTNPKRHSFRETPILEALSLSDCEMELPIGHKQLILFN